MSLSHFQTMRVVCREFYLFFIYLCFNDDSLTIAIVIRLFIYMFSSKSSYSCVFILDMVGVHFGSGKILE